MTLNRFFTSTGVFMFGVIFNTHATGFLPQEARSLAMGGTGVAVGNSRQAHYYNPSLLVNAPEDEDFNFEIDVAARAADSSRLIKGASDFDDNDPILSLAKSISALDASLNAVPFNPVVAQQAINDTVASSKLLRSSILDVTNKSLTIDGNVGLFVSVPNISIGWAAYINIWGNVAVQGNLSQVDDDAMLAIINAGENFSNNTLTPQDVQAIVSLDPTKSLTSNLSVQGAIVTEYGVALAKQQTINNYDLDIGITPKIQQVTTFGDQIDLEGIENGDQLFSQDNSDVSTSLNFDIGISKQLDENWTSGIVIKNIIPKTYNIKSADQNVKIAPSARIGVSWRNNWINAGADLDVTKNQDIASLTESQFISVGAEFDVKMLQLRAGYRHNLAEDGGSGPSIGFGLYLLGLNVDAAFAANTLNPSSVSDETDIDNINGSVQVGFNW